jgi:hypothetical protein
MGLLVACFSGFDNGIFAAFNYFEGFVQNSLDVSDMPAAEEWIFRVAELKAGACAGFLIEVDHMMRL